MLGYLGAPMGVHLLQLVGSVIEAIPPEKYTERLKAESIRDILLEAFVKSVEIETMEKIS